jgi:hypothetical protein
MPDFTVAMTGFEPATPSSRTKCATGLRYIPKNLFTPMLVLPNATFLIFTAHQEEEINLNVVGQ